MPLFRAAWSPSSSSCSFSRTCSTFLQSHPIPSQLQLISHHSPNDHNFRDKYRVQHEITQLFGKPRPIAPIDCFQNLVGLFQQVGLDGIEILLAIPWTPVRLAQSRHDVDEPLKLLSCAGLVRLHELDSKI